MKDIVLKQILPKIEKLIGPYIEAHRGDAKQNKYYIISPNRMSTLKNSEEREVVTKLVEQANNIRNAEVTENATDDYFSGIFGGLNKALERIVQIKCSGIFYTSRLEQDVSYEYSQILGIVDNYMKSHANTEAIARIQQQANADATARIEQALAQATARSQQLQERYEAMIASERKLSASKEMERQWLEEELALIAADPSYLAKKTPAYFKLASATPNHPHQKMVNPANVPGTLSSSAPQKPLDKDRAYLSKYFGDLPTKILELLSCLSNVNECKEFAFSAMRERILSYKTPAPQNLVTEFRKLIKSDHAEAAQIENALSQLEGLILRDNTGTTHADIVNNLLSIEGGRLTQHAVNRTANVEGVTPEYQILDRIKQFLVPRGPTNTNFPWEKVLLPDFPEDFIDKINKQMAQEMAYKGPDAQQKRTDLLTLLKDQDNIVFKWRARAAANTM